MVSFSERFQQFIPPDEEAIRAAIVDGLVVLDSNVLLSAYRFAPKSRNELLDALALVGDRLWVPYQVGLEFHQNRLKVIADHDAAYKEVIDAVEQRRDDVLPELQKKIRELSNRVALPIGERDVLLKKLEPGFRELSSALLALRDSHGVGAPSGPDVILSRIDDLLSSRIGDPFTDGEEELEKAEALARIQTKVPPGYRDATKDDPQGDYFVWSQALREARSRNAQALVFVTSDVKDDWYLRLKGQPIMARTELSLECKERSGARLVMLPTRLFLSYAQKWLKAEVSDETIRQAERVQLDDDRRETLKQASLKLEQTGNAEQRMMGRLMAAENERSFLQAELDRAVYELEKSIAARDSFIKQASGGELAAKLDEAEQDASRRRSVVLAARRRLAEIDDRVAVERAEVVEVRETRERAVIEFKRLQDALRG